MRKTGHSLSNANTKGLLGSRVETRAAIAWCAVAALLAAAPARAETAASPLLPPDHWASEAVSRLDQLGLLGDWLPAQKSVHVQSVADALVRAEAIARDANPDALPLVLSWRERFDREYPGVLAEDVLLGARLSGGFEAGRARAFGPPSAAPQTVRLDPPETTPFLEAGGALRPARWLAVSARGRVDQDGGSLPDGEIAAAFSWLSLHVGRARPGFGFQPDTGVMLSGRATVDRIELITTRPVRLPWVFGKVGTWTADSFLARFGGSRWPDHPWFWGTSLRWRLHPRFTLGGQRSILFGGEQWRDFPVWHRALVLVGLDNYRENNMLTVSARWRMPTEAVVPLVLDVDWGTDDDPQAAVKIPGLVAGVTVPLLGSLPVSLGAEVAWFGRACCRNYDAPWYTHGQYTQGWSVGQTPLGDPLGGNGRALRLRGTADPSQHVRFSSVLWAQDRFSTNLYAPQAAGRSYGARFQAELRAGRGALELRGSHERGDAGWRTSDAVVQATLFF